MLTRRALVGAIAVLPLARSGALAATALPKMVIHKDPTCGCCGGWVEHVRAAGFPAEVVEAADLARIKARLRVPQSLASCHTAEVGGYVIEGHVPASVVQRLLTERPQAIGLAVPGMPVGSPGMEVAGAEPETYDVILFGPGGERSFARFHGARPV
jgi:hypothetical protein